MSIILDGTNGISAANVFGRNVIINGDGRINQRGYTSGTATSGAGQYTLDRWKVVTSGQNLTFTGDDSRRVMTAPAGGAEQVIEDKNIVGGTYVINWDGTATATVNGSAVSKGGTFNLPANTHATVRFIGGTFTDVQIEAGSVATPFERRPFGMELALCQRYFEVVGHPFGAGRVNSAGQHRFQALFKHDKRTTPSVSFVGTFSVSDMLTDDRTATSGFSLQHLTPFGCFIVIASGSVANGNFSAGTVIYSLSQNGVLLVSAEL